MSEAIRVVGAPPARITMTREEEESVGLKKQIRRFYDEVLAKGKRDRIGEFLAPDARIEHPLLADRQGPEALTEIVETYHRAFTDLRVTVTDLMVEDGQRAAVRAVVTATHSGPWMGREPTQKPVTWTSTALFQLRGGRISRFSVDEDLLGLARQLGAIRL